MKKRFVEPKIVRIDLKITENIAQSEQYGEEYIGHGEFHVYTKQFVENCHDYYVNTNPLLPTVGHGYEIVDDLVIAIAMGRCFTNPAEQARAFMMYGI